MSEPLDPRTVRYRIAFPEPPTRLFAVTVRVPIVEPRAALDLAMPAWTPGSYRIRDFARHVQDLTAPVPWRKVDKNTWRFEVAGLGELAVSYRVYANELTVRTAHLDERHAFWNGANLCLYVAGELDRPARIEVAGVPPGWAVVTGLDGLEGEGHAFLAPDYDSVVDAPFAAGPLAIEEFEVGGVRHRLVMDGAGNYDLGAIRDDVAKIVRAELAMFGGRPPYPHYTFICEVAPEGLPAGGLEHARSSVLMWNRFRFRPSEKYIDFLSLAAHEYFHLWNAKRLRPRELGPFEYGRENHTRALWIVEGVTSYYDELFLRRAGIIDADAYLKKIAEHVQTIEETPGRRHQSLEEASFDAWIKYYQRNEHSVNATVSYYEKGQLVAWLLDLEVRARSGGERSLDDVLRSLYREHPETGPGYELSRFEALASEAAGQDLAWFFADYVRGVRDLDYERHLAPFGLRLRFEPRSKPPSAAAGEGGGRAEEATGEGPGQAREGAGEGGGEEKGPPEPETRAYLGARTRSEGAKTVVSEVIEGSPAWVAGLAPLDEIIALDGFRTGHDQFEARLHERRPGDRVELAVFRADRLLRIGATLEGRPWVRAAIQRRPDAGEAERRLYEGWLGEPWKAPQA